MAWVHRGGKELSCAPTDMPDLPMFSVLATEPLGFLNNGTRFHLHPRPTGVLSLLFFLWAQLSAATRRSVSEGGLRKKSSCSRSARRPWVLESVCRYCGKHSQCLQLASCHISALSQTIDTFAEDARQRQQVSSFTLPLPSTAGRS